MFLNLHHYTDITHEIKGVRKNGAFLDRRSKIVSSGKREQPVVIEDTVVEYAVIEVAAIEDAAIEDLEE